ncbi:hemolysin expression modulating protein [Nitrosomonas sp.]|uniref:hemolysin expression modulating protein n=1 Tax=Nitrosomonas sp. TaxID=42353 RepID=UPI002633A123|nr:hemolysin expression modulating protein [Nitrosomonas sp.]
MAITRDPRPSLGSGSIKFIDGFPFEGLGSAGFSDNDLLIIGDDLDNNGDSTDNDLTGGSGNDEIRGAGGNDILREGLGNGILNGGDGNDDLDGQEGTEKLFGGAGDDILRAGGSIPANTPVPPGQPAGDYDRLTGGEGFDTFGFYGVGTFEITDFTLGQDRLFFDSEILGIHQLSELTPYITGLDDRGDSGFTVEFVGGAASIELVNVNIDSITAGMIVFNL